MIEIPYNEEYRKVWDDFCFSHSQAWFWHTTQWIDYCMSASFSVESVNLSHLIIDSDNEEILAIVPLLLESTGDKQNFSFSKGPCPAPLINENCAPAKKKQIELYILSGLQLKSELYNAQTLMVRQSNCRITKTNLDELSLYKNGYTDISNYTSILDLSSDAECILANMSKGHKSEIKKGIKYDLTLNIYKKNNLDRQKFMEFQTCYFQAAGKATRPQKAFDFLEQMVYSGNAFIIESVENEKVTGYAFFIHYKGYAYYAMSCRVKSNISKVNPGHSLIWSAIRFLKSIGINDLELGEQYFSPTLYYPVDQKAISISLFKRGFGGELIRQPIGEKIFKIESVRGIYEQRIDQYIKSCGDIY